MPFKPSPQQDRFFKWILTGVGSAVLEAVAGSGKTTTLVEGLSLMKGTIFFGAYNKKIADEIKERVKERPGLFVGTMHAAGLRAWRRFAPQVKVDDKGHKLRDIFRAAAKRNPSYAPYEGAVLDLVSKAKQAAFGASRSMNATAEWMRLIDHYNIDVLDSADLVIKLARKTLQESIKLNAVLIDYDDMIYAPLVGCDPDRPKHCDFWKHDWVLIDEAQDTNESRRLLALHLLKSTGRLVAVGDRHQAIYGFTGADADALDLIATAVSATQLPLTVTYRCPRSVVAHAKQYVNHIEAHESAPEGKVAPIVYTDMTKTIKVGDAILSRFNAPNIKIAYSLIAAGIPAKVEGRAIGEGLVKVAKRLKAKDFDEFLSKLQEYQDREIAKLLEKEKETAASLVEDTCNCLRVVVDRCMKVPGYDSGKPAELIEAEVNKIFGDGTDNKNAVLLSSIHKSKGREWNRVFWLQTGPSRWARQPWEVQQETNLMYVAATRAKKELYLLETA